MPVGMTEPLRSTGPSTSNMLIEPALSLWATASVLDFGKKRHPVDSQEKQPRQAWDPQTGQSRWLENH